jgi:hypothetical protein
LKIILVIIKRGEYVLEVEVLGRGFSTAPNSALADDCILTGRQEATLRWRGREVKVRNNCEENGGRTLWSVVSVGIESF